MTRASPESNSLRRPPEGPAIAARRHAARSLDAGAPTATLDAAMAKRYATDACYDVTNSALQLLGGYG